MTATTNRLVPETIAAPTRRCTVTERATCRTFSFTTEAGVAGAVTGHHVATADDLFRLRTEDPAIANAVIDALRIDPRATVVRMISAGCVHDLYVIAGTSTITDRAWGNSRAVVQPS